MSIVAMAVAACGGDDDAATTSPPTDAPPVATEAPGSGDDENAGDEGALVIDGELVASRELYEAAQAEGQLVLYTAYLENHAEIFTDAFTEDTGIPVEVMRLPTGRLMERVLSEAGAGQLGGDVVQVSEPQALIDLIDEDLLECDPVGDEIIEQMLLPEYVSPEGCYYATTASVMVIAYNTALIDPSEAPQTWEEYVDPKWTDATALSYIGVGGSAYSVHHMLRELYGIEYWERLRDINPQIMLSNAVISEELQRGEISMAIASPSVGATAIAAGAPVDMVFPSDAVAPYATITGYISRELANNPNAAELFRNWSLSRRGQVEYSRGGTYAVRRDVPPPEHFPEFSSLNLVTAPLDEWLENQAAWVQEWNEVMQYIPE